MEIWGLVHKTFTGEKLLTGVFCYGTVNGKLKVLGKSVGLCKTTKRKDQLSVYLFLYGESSVKISTQTDSY